MAIAEAGEFKGNKMIVLKTRPDSDYPFQFGQKKAQLIVECFDAIRYFAEHGEVLSGETGAAPALTPAPVDNDDTPF
jgi:hypothetical protein